MENGFYSQRELAEIGFKSVGEHVLISRKASIYKPSVISLGSHVRIDDFCILSGGQYIDLGSFVHIGAYSALFGGGGILLEDFAGMSPRCSLHSECDDFLGRSMTGPTIPKKYKPKYKSAPIIFRKHSGLGSTVTVLPGVELSEGAGIGGHSLVNRSCEPWTLYSGVPAERVMARLKKVLDLETQLMEDIASGTAWDDSSE